MCDDSALTNIKEKKKTSGMLKALAICDMMYVQELCHAGLHGMALPIMAVVEGEVIVVYDEYCELREHLVSRLQDLKAGYKNCPHEDLRQYTRRIEILREEILDVDYVLKELAR